MLATTTNTVDQLSMDGPIRVVTAVTIALIMIGLFAWALQRESKIIGQRNAALFWALRSIAVATVIWMLLAPVNVRLETSTTRKAVAVITDISGSMQIIDPAGKAEDLRWAAAQDESTEYKATQAADRSVAAIRIASQHVTAAIEALQQRKPESQVVAETKAADTAIARVGKHLISVQAATDQIKQHEHANLIAAGLLESLADTEFEDFHRLCVALQKGRTPSQKGWRESLPDLAYRLAELTHRVTELARQVALEESTYVTNQQPGLLTQTIAQSRLERAIGLIKQLENGTLKPIGEKADVVFSSFDQGVSQLADQRQPAVNLRSFVDNVESHKRTETAGTSVSSALEELNRWQQDQPLAAAFLLTDMAHNDLDGESPREVAAMLKTTPVYIVPVGNPNHERDISLLSVSAPSVAMRNDDIVIEASIQAYDCEDEVCSVQLLQDGNVIDFREVQLDADFTKRSLRFERRMSDIGMMKFQIAVVPLDGELTEENNFDEFDVTVTRDEIKVLLADEYSRWEQRYLAQLFRRDEKVDCDELLYHPRMKATGHREASGALPETAEDWDRYDVVMLGDLPPEHLSDVAQESMIEYLEKRGGTVVLIAGSESMPRAYANHPLSSVLPVQEIADPSPVSSDGFAFRITELGRSHDALLIGQTDEATRIAWDFINQYSPLHTLSSWRQPKPSAQTLISAVPRGSKDEIDEMKSNAFLCWQPVGRGRIVYLSGPETYRLRFLRGDALHYRFWGQLLRWAIASELAPGTELVRIRTEKSRYDSREPVRANVQVVDHRGEPVSSDDLHVNVTSANHNHSVPLVPDTEAIGNYNALIGELPPGVYRVEPAGAPIDGLHAETSIERASASFTVKEDLPMELVDTRCDRALARQIAKLTGGQLIPPTAVGEILELTDLEPIVSEKVERSPLWVQWKYLWLVFGCLQAEWVIRKLKGLS